MTTGSKGFVTIPYDCTITDWYLAADQSGSIQFLVKNNGDVITSEGDNPLIKLTASQSGNGGSEAWTFPIIAAGDILEFEIPGTPATITRVNLVIKAI